MFLWHISTSSKIIKVIKNNNNDINNNRFNVLIKDMEIKSENEADTDQIIIKEKCNKMEKESNQEREKVKF